MCRRMLFALVLALAPLSAALAAEKIPLGPPAATLEEVQNAPDDAKLLGKFLGAQFREINHLSDDNPAAANKALDELAATLEKLPVTGDAATMRDRAKGSITMLRERMNQPEVSLAELEKAVLAKPDDAEALSGWSSKALGEIGGIAYSRPDQAEEKLAAAKAVVEKIAAAATDEATKERLASYSAARGRFTSLENAIAKGREYVALVGKDAAPLDVTSWVNGQPVSPADLKGKVVLLDFWAIWCGPCIATFPHLREWQDKYADKGLVIIGMTRNYQYQWDDAAGYCAKGEDVTPEKEAEMLEKFAAYYHLKHRFAVQEDKALSEYYGVSGIPHVVVIDQAGKVRMIRVGSGKQNAEDIGGLLAELLK
jgi:thiol-disulfide isomerase/thioredoxin